MVVLSFVVVFSAISRLSQRLGMPSPCCQEEEERLRDQWSATVANTIAKKKGARASADGGDRSGRSAATHPSAFNSQKKRPPAVVPVPDRSVVASQKRYAVDITPLFSFQDTIFSFKLL